MSEVGKPGSFDVDVASCDREPIHVLGSVQPFGCLIAVSADWMIARVSDNVSALLGPAPEAMLGQPVADYFTPDGLHLLRSRAAVLRTPDAVERLFHVDLAPGCGPFDVALHISRGALVIELEPATNAADATGPVRAMMMRIDQTQGMASFFHEAARQVRGATGFDRVMVYRFDEAGAGEVIAEARESRLDSYLGLHYPASDIPTQARALYLRNTFRIIADVDAKPSPITPQLDGSGEPLDLSMSVLRAVSPTHIEYLRNMGVAASLSISIVVEGRLWGLFACHHYSPRLPSFLERTAAELFGAFFSMKLESRERQLANEYERRAREIVQRLMAGAALDAGRLSDAEWLGSLVFESIPADGVAVCLRDSVVLSGLTPSEAQVRTLLGAFGAQARGEVFATACLSNLTPEAASYANRAAGMLAIPVSRLQRDYVILFRAEQPRSVRWAGEPGKMVEVGPGGDRITPRKSFEEWSEIVRGCSTPFTQAEVRVAETLRVSLLEVILKLSDETGEERRSHDERQRLLIAELNHRVRNILALIRALMSQTRASAADPADLYEILDQRIQALARAHNQVTAESWGPGALSDLFEAELSAFLGEARNRVRLDGPELQLEPAAFTVLALVIHELTTNAVKYGALSDNGRVEIVWRREDDGGVGIEWRETGGPVVQAPSRRGFGSTVIEQSVSHELGGRAAIRFEPMGFEADLHIPARYVSTSAPPKPAARHEPDESGEGKPLDGAHVLLVEDSLIIALDVEELLLGLGAARVSIAASVDVARQVLETDRIDFAVLDLNLGRETSLPVADALTARKTPFLFASGYGDAGLLPTRFNASIVVAKPYDCDTLRRAVAAAL